MRTATSKSTKATPPRLPRQRRLKKKTVANVLGLTKPRSAPSWYKEAMKKRRDWIRSQLTREGIRFLAWLYMVHSWDNHHGDKGPPLPREDVARRPASERKRPRSGKRSK